MSARPFRRSVLLTTAVAAAIAVAGSGAAWAGPGSPGTPRYAPGADGAGDPYFPLAGNGGIDVIHYDLDLDYTPPAPAPAPLIGALTGVATIQLAATADLDRFNLDLRGLTASRVTVNGKAVAFDQVENELRISPRPMLKTGQQATVVVEYAGATGRPTDNTDALYGWVTTRDGAMVVNEADGAATWFPSSDHPTDKSTYTFEITVPDGLVVVANGLLEGTASNGGLTTWSWDAPDPMAAYLATATVGDFTLNKYTASDGTPIIDAIDPDRAGAAGGLALTGEMLAFFAEKFGPYPFVSYGAIVDDDSVGYALETQTRSIFSRNAREGTVAHELAHQWMGDDVSPQRWADIWLNEGWATYASWMWAEHRNQSTAADEFDFVMSTPADDDFWHSQVALPGAEGLFNDPVYDRGAATLHALRVKIGDDTFFDLAKEWVSRFGGGSASTADFIALSEEVSGQDLDAFFQTWLYTPEKPTVW